MLFLTPLFFRLLLAKLRKRFKDIVATDRIVLHAINSEETVSSIDKTQMREEILAGIMLSMMRVVLRNNNNPDERSMNLIIFTDENR